MTSEPSESPGSSIPVSFPLQVDKLGVSAGDSGRELLSEITLSVKPGEFVCVLGPSGCGKTTLLQLVLGFYRPQRGELSADGIAYEAWSMRALRAGIGVVPQSVTLLPGTVILTGTPHRRSGHRLQGKAEGNTFCEKH